MWLRCRRRRPRRDWPWNNLSGGRRGARQREREEEQRRPRDLPQVPSFHLLSSPIFHLVRLEQRGAGGGEVGHSPRAVEFSLSGNRDEQWEPRKGCPCSRSLLWQRGDEPEESAVHTSRKNSRTSSIFAPGEEVRRPKPLSIPLRARPEGGGGERLDLTSKAHAAEMSEGGWKVLPPQSWRPADARARVLAQRRPRPRRRAGREAHSLQRCCVSGRARFYHPFFSPGAD